MREAWIFYDLATGEGNGGWGVESASLDGLTPPEGMGLMQVPLGSVSPAAVVDLAKVKAMAAAKVDAEAESQRLAFITPGAGQAMTYQYKAAEAAALLADPDAPTPFLAAEAEATGVAVNDLAELVRDQVQAWTVMGARIEARRMKANAEIDDAANPGGIAAASTIDWATVTASEPVPMNEGAD